MCRVKLPNADATRIPENKIVGYLLSSTHRAGKSKAAFFVKHGFASSSWQALAHALRKHGAENPVLQAEETAYGTRYVVDGPLVAPDGSALNARTVWFINRGTTVPRFATAHPLKRKPK